MKLTWSSKINWNCNIIFCHKTNNLSSLDSFHITSSSKFIEKLFAACFVWRNSRYYSANQSFLIMQIKITQLQWTGNIITKQNAEAKAETFEAGRIAGLMMWILILKSLGNDRSLKDVTEWWRMWSFTQLESRWKNFSFDFHSSNFWATVPAENKSDCEGKSSFEQRSYFFCNVLLFVHSSSYEGIVKSILI